MIRAPGQFSPSQLVSLLLLFSTALWLRVFDLSAPGILPEREFRSMVIARVSYFQGTDTVQDWRKEVAKASEERLGRLEPPILESLVSRIYRVAGREVVGAARVLGALFWVAGGLLFFWVAGRLMSTDGAILATAYYLFFPLGVLVSRSFQPDSMMILLFLASLAAILSYHEKPTVTRVLAAGLLSGITLFVRPLPLFTLSLAFAGPALYRKRSWKILFDPHLLAFFTLAILPAGVYYASGLLWGGFLAGQAEMSFRPHLLLHREYWQGWLITGASAVGLAPLALSLVSLPMVERGPSRFLLGGLWLGYFVFGLVFNHHIHTHGYYHFQLAVILALSMGPVLDLVTQSLRLVLTAPYRWLPILAALSILSFFTLREVRAGLRAPSFENPGLARQVGEVVHHSDRVVWVARHYGQPLEYYGEISGMPWPKAIEYWLYRRPGERALSIQERLDNLGFAPEYFVITDFAELDRRHADLKAFLAENCPVVAETPGYLVYRGACDP